MSLRFYLYTLILYLLGMFNSHSFPVKNDFAIIPSPQKDSIPHVPKTENGLARTPPMGWNSWNHFSCDDISETVVKETIDSIAATGLKEAGYEYVVIDDCWFAGDRDSNRELEVNSDKFPHGIKWLADYAHKKGLKLGIYESVGHPCHDKDWPGSYQHEKQDAKTFAKWGIDYLKYDDCMEGDLLEDFEYISSYIRMAKGLRDTGRDIVYSIHDPATHFDNTKIKAWEWAPNIANLWRTTNDIKDNWESMISRVDQEVGLQKYASPGHWNDPDMLEVGNGGMSHEEYKTHFSLWAILSAPLMMGNDVRNMKKETREILENKDVIAINQDKLGKQGHKIMDQGDQEVWVKPLHDGSVGVLLLNRSSEQEAWITASVNQVGLGENSWYDIKNLWSGEKGKTSNIIRGKVPPHGVVFYRVKPQSK